MKDEVNLFDFGVNENGEYVNLVEYEKLKHDIEEVDFNKWLETNENPLIHIAYDFLINPDFYKTYNKIIEELEWIAEQKVYHYGNMEKGLYIYTIFNGDCWAFVFENEHHIMVNLNYIYSQKELEKYLFGKELIQMNALSVRCYELNGKRIDDYGDKEKDIRYRVIIDEWQMDKYSENRMKENKKIKDFYEVALPLPKLMEYWGES